MEGVPRIEVNQVKLMKAFRIKYGEVERGKGGREGCGAREERGVRGERGGGGENLWQEYKWRKRGIRKEIDVVTERKKTRNSLCPFDRKRTNHKH